MWKWLSVEGTRGCRQQRQEDAGLGEGHSPTASSPEQVGKAPRVPGQKLEWVEGEALAPVSR